jgi:hypothetical protein
VGESAKQGLGTGYPSDEDLSLGTPAGNREVAMVLFLT